MSDVQTVGQGVILKRPARFKNPTPDEWRFFLISTEGDWHIAGPGFVPMSFGVVTVRAECGAQVEAIGSANYSSRPCSACLEKCIPAIKEFYRTEGREP